MSENHTDILTEFEIQQRTKMRNAVVTDFEHDILFAMYEKRNHLDELLSDEILLLETEKLYSSQEVADILRTTIHQINNRRREFVEYVKPTIIGNKTNKHWLHDYKAILRLKMILGLTGTNGEYNVPQLKAILSGEFLSEGDPESAETEVFLKRIQDFIKSEVAAVKEMVVEQDKKYYLLNQKFETLPSPDTYEKQLQGIIEEFKESSSKLHQLRNICSDILSKINSSSNISEKEALLSEFEKLAKEYPTNIDIIDLYRTWAEDKMNIFRQDQRELQIKELKSKAAELYGQCTDYSVNDEVRNHAYQQLQKLMEENEEIRSDIKIYIAQINQLNKIKKEKDEETQQESQKKVGFMSHVLSYFKK
ncbi:hypothetical protein [Ammoniphilus sp. 3BR4]|uniref:hypothetical protein n=1 Tax=Ammoniphilus sp. 3BR4 TaxID=3158265 RepID=UPI00346639DE